METMFGRPSRKLLPLVLFLFVLVSVSCGKANSRTYTKIDDMEGSGGRIEWQPSKGWPAGQRPGFWSSSTSCAQASRILPEPFSVDPDGWAYATVPLHETMPGVTSTHAAELRTKPGEPLVGVWLAKEKDWGANMGFDFADLTDGDAGPSQAPTVDAGADFSGEDAGGSATEADSAVDGAACGQGAAPDPDGVTANLEGYCGITFWAKAAADGRQAIRVQFNDVNTDPRGNQCNPSDPTDVAYCYDGFGKALMLTDTFTQYWVDFSELQQEPSWGYHSGSFTLAKVYGLNFQVDLPSCLNDPTANCVGIPAPVAFDIWIDDLYFVNCAP